jgi:YHS domain-containing protein
VSTIPARAACAVLFLFALAVALAGCGTVHNTVRSGDDERVILRGNDAVAYFTAGKPVKGDPAIKSVYDGDVYRFATEANKKSFDADPKRYAPAYAGFCASGAPYALKANIDADVFTIYKGRLYLFGSERVKAHWLMDGDENVRKGDSYWENETKDVPFRWQNFKRYTFKVPGYKTDAELDAEYLRRFGKLPPGAPPLKG